MIIIFRYMRRIQLIAYKKRIGISPLSFWLPKFCVFVTKFRTPMAERQGFEPWEGYPSTVFKTAAFDRSATSPKLYIATRLHENIDIRDGGAQNT